MDSKIIGASFASLAMVVASAAAAWSMATSSPEQSTAAEVITYVTEAPPRTPATVTAVAIVDPVQPVMAAPVATSPLAVAPVAIRVAPPTPSAKAAVTTTAPDRRADDESPAQREDDAERDD